MAEGVTKLPYNDGAEQAVLGAMISSPESRNAMLNALEENDFYNQNHRLIFRAIANLFEKGIQLDISTLVDELDVNMKALNKIGGVAYLYELQELFVGDSTAIHHRNIVKDASLSRSFIMCLKECIKGFEDREFEDVTHYVADCEKKILDITKERRISDFVSSSEVVDAVTNKIKLTGKTRNNSYCTGIPTGFRSLDIYTSGWQPGSLIILAARPSVGKTALSITFAYEAAQQTGRTVAYFSLEMAADAIIQRLLASRAQINSVNLATANLTNEDWIALDEASNAVKGIKLFIDDTSAARLSDIRTKAQKLKATHGDLGAIFIDYLGLITTSRNNKDDQSRQQEVAEISRSLKALARELDVPVICLCQLSRASETRPDHTPRLSDLRDSGSIEQDADQVLFIYREDYQNSKIQKEHEDDDPTSNDPMTSASETKILIAKNRNGKVGTVKLTFFKNCGRFVEIDNRVGEM